jgi:ubiquinone/menaquinone biosynthesis C-methylase UbiE
VCGASVFDRNAEEYDNWYREEPGLLVLESEVKAIRALALEGVGIEVGVGTGVFSSRLGVPFGLDPALKMLQKAKTRGISVVRAVGEFTPLKDGSMDYVLFAFTLCFLTNLQASLQEAWRVLKPRGNIVLGFISQDSHWGRLYSRKKAEDHRFYKHATFYVMEEVEEALDRGGFKITDRVATLSQGPDDIKTAEEPSTQLDQGSFICIKAMKQARPSTPCL